MHMTVKQRRSILVHVALSGIMAALVCIATILIQIPNPPTRGYINIGDAMIFISALSFGTFVGGFAGAVGSSLADIINGYALFAPFTFAIKGAEGLLAGLITDRRSIYRDVLAVVIAGAEMIIGYFLAEFYPLQIGWAALTEVPGNIFQIFAGGAIGIPITLIIRRRLPEILSAKHD